MEKVTLLLNYYKILTVDNLINNSRTSQLLKPVLEENYKIK